MELLNPFRKIFVTEFYKDNAAFFVLVIALCFGFMSGTEHKALATFFVSSPVLTLIPFSAWILYTIKVISFNSKQCFQEHNNFLFDINLVPSSRKLGVVVFTITSQLTPAISYGLFLLLMAIQLQQPLEVVIVLSMIVVLVVIGAFQLLATLQKPRSIPAPRRLKAWLDARYAKGFVQITVEHLLRTQFLRLIGTKSFSCLILFATCRLYLFDVYDQRLLALAANLAGFAMVMIVLDIHRFKHSTFPIAKSIPYSNTRMLAESLMIYLIIIIPELIVVIRHLPEAISAVNATWIFLYMLSLLSLLEGVFHLTPRPYENISRWLVPAVIGSFILILCRVPLWILTTISAGTGLTFITARWRHYEWLEGTQSGDQSAI